MPHYQCQRCTACCRWPGQVRLTDPEITAMAELFGLSDHHFIQRYTRLRHDRKGLALLEKENGECLFLQHGDCLVQKAKPQQCKDFPNKWNFPGWRDICHAIEVSRLGMPRPADIQTLSTQQSTLNSFEALS